jgi:hypothetical protein
MMMMMMMMMMRQWNEIWRLTAFQRNQHVAVKSLPTMSRGSSYLKSVFFFFFVEICFVFFFVNGFEKIKIKKSVFDFKNIYTKTTRPWASCIMILLTLTWQTNKIYQVF